MSAVLWNDAEIDCLYFSLSIPLIPKGALNGWEQGRIVYNLRRGTGLSEAIEEQNRDTHGNTAVASSGSLSRSSGNAGGSHFPQVRRQRRTRVDCPTGPVAPAGAVRMQ